MSGGASAGTIRAGRAFVELGIKNMLDKGLRVASTQLKSFGQSVASIGTTLTGMGSAVTGPILAAMGVFTSVGDEIGDTAAKIGISTDALQELRFAAERSGSDAETLGTSLIKLQKNLAEAASGSKAAKAVFNELGVDPAKLKLLPVEEQMRVIGDRLKNVKSHADKMRIAMDVFGKSGAALVPMLENGRAGLDEFSARARELGIVLDSDGVAAAGALDDALVDLKKQLLAVAIQIGGAVAPAVTKFISVVQPILSTIITWIKNNKKLVVTVLAIGGIITGVGAALMAIGAVIWGVGAAFGVLSTVVGVLGTVMSGVLTVLGAIVSPIGAIVVGLGAAAVMFFKFTEAGRAFASDFGSTMSDLWDGMRQDFGAAWDGIKAAFEAGDLGMMAEIAFTGVKLVWERIVGAMKGVWISFNSMLVEKVREAGVGLVGIWRDWSQTFAEIFADWFYKWNLMISGEKDYLTESERTGSRDSSLNQYYDGMETGLVDGINSAADAMQQELKAQQEEAERASQARIAELQAQLAAQSAEAQAAAAKVREEREKQQKKIENPELPDVEAGVATAKAEKLTANEYGVEAFKKFADAQDNANKPIVDEIKKTNRILTNSPLVLGEAPAFIGGMT